jgi:hypothetical protein
MTARRAIGSLIATGGLLMLLAAPVGAGVIPCALQATVFGGSATEVNVGEEVLIEGFDFFPGNVQVTYSVGATLLSSVIVVADGTGAFTTTITPQAGEEGLWSVEATDSSKAQCTATTGFQVLGGTFACSVHATEGGGSPADVDVGEMVAIEGFDFPPGDVEVSFSVEGTSLSTVTVVADAAGSWNTTVTPQVGEEGLWTVEATADGELCTATTGFPVFGVTPTSTPPEVELPNVAAAPPSPVLPLWVVGVAVLALAAVILRLTLKRRRA